jgi:hypothetical protein
MGRAIGKPTIPYKKPQSTISQGAFLIINKNSQVTTILPNLVLKLIK